MQMCNIDVSARYEGWGGVSRQHSPANSPAGHTYVLLAALALARSRARVRLVLGWRVTWERWVETRRHPPERDSEALSMSKRSPHPETGEDARVQSLAPRQRLDTAVPRRFAPRWPRASTQH